MIFNLFAEKIEVISKESSRIKITALFANLFNMLNPSEAQAASYILLGGIGPNYKGQKFNLAEKQVLAFLQHYIGIKYSKEGMIEFLEMNNKVGDLGESIYLFIEKELKINLEEDQDKNPISFLEIYETLKELSSISGEGSVIQKRDFLLESFSQLSPLGKKYFVRILTGKLRLGVSVMGLLESFSIASSDDKKLKKQLEANYNVCADLGKIIYLLKNKQFNILENPKPEPGIPVCPAAAERVEDLTELLTRMKRFVVQPKLDGLRIQIHRFEQDGVVHVLLFSRNLLDLSNAFPEIVNIFKNSFSGTFILDGELIAFNKSSGANLSFQETIQRRRKHNIDILVETIPVKIYLFDILFFSNSSLLSLQYFERRDVLINNFFNQHDKVVVISENLLDLNGVQDEGLADVQANDFLENYFTEMIAAGYEGFIAKNYNSVYQAGKRGFSWIKIKELDTPRLGDTIDAVIIGYYFGKGRRANLGLGAFLMAVFDPINNIFQTIGRVGTGLTDQNLIELKESLGSISLKEKPNNYDVHSSLFPDVWVSPEIILELDADEITFSEIHTASNNLLNVQKGLSLRFPRVKSIRYDKSLNEITTNEELMRIFKKV